VLGEKGKTAKDEEKKSGPKMSKKKRGGRRVTAPKGQEEWGDPKTAGEKKPWTKARDIYPIGRDI